MAPAKKTKGAPSKSSRKAVNETRPLITKTGKPSRAAKSIANRARADAMREQGAALATEVVRATKEFGKDAAKKIGRPLLYPEHPWSDELGEKLFALVATGHTMSEIAEMEDMPQLLDLLRWAAKPTHPFSEIRVRAKELLIPLYEDQTKRISQQGMPGVTKITRQVIDREGNKRTIRETREGDNVERAKLAMEGLKWTLGHLIPKKHGRQATLENDKPNEQLDGLFAALKSGPAK